MSEKGSILVETALSFIVLVVFMFACVDLAYIIADKVHLQRIVREAAREAAITNSESTGCAKGRDLARMYFGRNAGYVVNSLTVTKKSVLSGDGKTAWFYYAHASYPHKVFGGSFLGLGEVELNARAVFGWWDYSPST